MFSCQISDYYFMGIFQKKKKISKTSDLHVCELHVSTKNISKIRKQSANWHGPKFWNASNAASCNSGSLVCRLRFSCFKYWLLFSFNDCVHPLKLRLNYQISEILTLHNIERICLLQGFYINARDTLSRILNQSSKNVSSNKVYWSNKVCIVCIY